mmetsp:Transcript_43885/g.70386  ORF Transcript_43885/g.70386 Transcript_43885/m.70386 type:complete len:166 (+) Transcript_43885:19-516(+)
MMAHLAVTDDQNKRQSKYIPLNNKKKQLALYEESKVHCKSERERQIAADSESGLTDIDSLLLQIQDDVDQIASDFVEFDTCIETRVMEMMRSSQQHMEWLRSTTHTSSVIAQKAADHAEIFRTECNKLNTKCKQLDSFDKFLVEIQTKLTLLETSADALMGAEIK